MKSPWKYLVQLVSPGRAAEETESLREIEVEKAVGEAADPIEQAPITAADNLDPATTDATVIVVDEPEEAPITTVVEPSVDGRVSRPKPEPRPQALPKRRKRGSRKADAGAVAVSDVVEYGDGGSVVVKPPITFAEEMTALDEEIRQLRRSLADKLLLQNAQLKKMLERYGAS